MLTITPVLALLDVAKESHVYCDAARFGDTIYYDFELRYHPGKANVVADALSRKSIHVASLMLKEYELLESFKDMNLGVVAVTNRFGMECPAGSVLIT
ncbi:hypothetical protein RJT34_33140 [Clitoria ternatea]|uniref:Uncharacterized protein n=1 Tax=Clitoria ternatea TaxID=43366 RepID=A0AAN9EZC5_CLITE